MLFLQYSSWNSVSTLLLCPVHKADFTVKILNPLYPCHGEVVVVMLLTVFSPWHFMKKLDIVLLVSSWVTQLCLPFQTLVIIWRKVASFPQHVSWLDNWINKGRTAGFCASPLICKEHLPSFAFPLLSLTRQTCLVLFSSSPPTFLTDFWEFFVQDVACIQGYQESLSVVSVLPHPTSTSFLLAFFFPPLFLLFAQNSNECDRY